MDEGDHDLRSPIYDSTSHVEVQLLKISEEIPHSYSTHVPFHWANRRCDGRVILTDSEVDCISG